MMTLGGHSPSKWREYQKRLHRSARFRRIWRKLPLLLLLSASGCLVVMLGINLWPKISVERTRAGFRPRGPKKAPEIQPKKLSRADVSTFLPGLVRGTSELPNSLVVKKDGHRLTISTSVDRALQEYIASLLGHSQTLEAAVVVMDPYDGRVLAMENYEAGGKKENLCLKADFPAASLFKIVSAAAALEVAGLTPDSPVFFRGRKYTLYKSQLTSKRGKYTSETTFRRAFASSINSVFGKLGIYRLGKERITEYAGRFLFNQPIPFDLPVGVSTVQVPDDQFGLAEIASGFNKKTRVSPLHVALLAGAVANHGEVMTPWVVKSVKDESGKVLYKVRPGKLAHPIEEKTARDLRVLMRETVLHGTCRKAFHRLRRKKAFRGMELGAKTGTINDRYDRVKFDWFAGYALPHGGEGGICLGVLAVHGERLGVRSSNLARYVIDYAFSSRH